MPVSKAQQKARDKYLEKFEEIRARVPKGRKEEIKAHAVTFGESVNGFIGRAINETMERDTAAACASGSAVDIPAPGAPPDAVQAVSAPAGVMPDIPLEKLAQAKAHAEAHRETAGGFIARAIDETIERDNQKSIEE